MSKICERMITNRLNLCLIGNQHFPSCQIGFLRFRDSQAAITLLHKDILWARKDRKFILGICLELKAAYDSIYIDVLILKCAQIGIPGTVHRWILKFLGKRRIKASRRKVYSAYHSLDRGSHPWVCSESHCTYYFLLDLLDVVGPRSSVWFTPTVSFSIV